MNENITLRELLIGGNSFNEEAGKAIANGLTANRSIITLDIGWNPIGPESVVILAKALEENSTLLTLGLSNSLIEL
jgi:Ran GTPase-activating protein (RanGAP) involved in mRNA processing and transport